MGADSWTVAPFRPRFTLLARVIPLCSSSPRREWYRLPRVTACVVSRGTCLGPCRCATGGEGREGGRAVRSCSARRRRRRQPPLPARRACAGRHCELLAVSVVILSHAYHLVGGRRMWEGAREEERRSGGEVVSPCLMCDISHVVSVGLPSSTPPMRSTMRCRQGRNPLETLSRFVNATSTGAFGLLSRLSFHNIVNTSKDSTHYLMSNSVCSIEHGTERTRIAAYPVPSR
ncbi:hypothetical protein C8Q76DRAFT_755086 [Earliella scabrosa]|nr:hypothetical protein C8Q76DRAFT_755086 [Earliella scabrosa]